MVVLHMKTKEFFEFLKNEGAIEIDSLPEENIVVFEYAGQIVPIQIRAAYYPCYVVKVCDDLKISCPKIYSHVADQIKQATAMSKRK